MRSATPTIFFDLVGDGPVGVDDRECTFCRAEMRSATDMDSRLASSLLSVDMILLVACLFNSLAQYNSKINCYSLASTCTHKSFNKNGHCWRGYYCQKSAIIQPSTRGANALWLAVAGRKLTQFSWIWMVSRIWYLNGFKSFQTSIFNSWWYLAAPTYAKVTPNLRVTRRQNCPVWGFRSGSSLEMRCVHQAMCGVEASNHAHQLINQPPCVPSSSIRLYWSVVLPR
jgi:hypothetical protein